MNNIPEFPEFILVANDINLTHRSKIKRAIAIYNFGSILLWHNDFYEDACFHYMVMWKLNDKHKIYLLTDDYAFIGTDCKNEPSDLMVIEEI